MKFNSLAIFERFRLYPMFDFNESTVIEHVCTNTYESFGGIPVRAELFLIDVIKQYQSFGRMQEKQKAQSAGFDQK